MCLSGPPCSVSLALRTWGAHASALLTPLRPTLQQLQLLGRLCQEQGIPFPPISPSPEEQRQPGECHVFSDPGCPEAPVVLHFPLVNDSFQEHSAPGEPWSQPLQLAVVVPLAPCPSSHLLCPLCLSTGDPKPSSTP